MADVALRCYRKPMVSTCRNTFSFVGLHLLGCALVVPRSCPHAALLRRPCDVNGLLGRRPFAASALSRGFGRASSAMPVRCQNSVMNHGRRSITVLRKANGEHSSEYLLIRRPRFASVCLGGASELSARCPIASPLRCNGAARAPSVRCLGTLSGLRPCLLGDSRALPRQF